MATTATPSRRKPTKEDLAREASNADRRAKRAKAKAEAEKARADQLAQELEELKANGHSHDNDDDNGTPPVEPPTLVGDPDGPPADVPDDSQPEGHSRGNRFLALCAAALVALLIVGAVMLADDDSQSTPANASDGGSTTEQPADAEPTPADKQADLKAAQQKYRSFNAKDFKRIAGRDARNHHENGRFIDEGINGAPAEKLETILVSAAEDRVSAVGIAQALSKNQFGGKDAADAIEGKHAGDAHYQVWDTVRDLLANRDSGVKGDVLNGEYYNAGLSPEGVLTATKTTWKDEPATTIDYPSMMAGNTFIKGDSVTFRDLCNNLQTKAPIGVVTDKPGVIPPTPDNPSFTPTPENPTPPTDEMHPPFPEGIGPGLEDLPDQDPNTPAYPDSPQAQPVDPVNPDPSNPGGSGGDQGQVGSDGTGQPGTGTIPGSDDTGATNPGGGPSHDNPEGISGGEPPDEGGEPDW